MGKLSNDMNFFSSGEAGFDVTKIGEFNGENISAQFVEV
jgi:hypothetical protein